VGLGLELRGLSRAERDRCVDEKLALVQLDQWAEKRPHELSGGMQQRVGLARALATDADILLMDEPFSALDPLIRERLQDELLELQRNLKKTIVFVSHDLDEALKIGTHIAIMDGGRVVQYGTPEQIVTEPSNAYVRDFVANVNPLNVLKAASIMRPVSDTLHAAGGGVSAATPVREIIEMLDMGRGPLRIVNEHGMPVGVIDTSDILGALARRETGSATPAATINNLHGQET